MYKCTHCWHNPRFTHVWDTNIIDYADNCMYVCLHENYKPVYVHICMHVCMHRPACTAAWHLSLWKSWLQTSHLAVRALSKDWAPTILCVCACVYVYVRLCMYANNTVYAHACVCVYDHVCVSRTMCMCIYRHKGATWPKGHRRKVVNADGAVHVRIHIHTYTYAYTPTYVYISEMNVCVHTYIHPHGRYAILTDIGVHMFVMHLYIYT